MVGSKRIGIDLDNTLIDYDQVFRVFAQERGLIDPLFAGGKDDVRAAIRALPDGELAWQRLQGVVYGKGVRLAVLFDGADAFLRRARDEGYGVTIVSHKTEFGHYDPDRINLRSAALDWLRARGFFDDDGFGLRRESVIFTGTRTEKIQVIRKLGVDFFIDDLIEVLEDRDFPEQVTGILFTRGAAAVGRYPWALSHWQEITRMVFG